VIKYKQRGKQMDYENMKMDDIIKRINELYKKMKEEGLNEAEKEEQQILRRRYIDSVKGNFRAQLETVEYKKK
jgi:uncharacterized protein YnzC (UPF0291/DUF896 family)